LKRSTLAVALFLSGAASLLFEVVWVRVLALSFGSTVLSLSLVTSAFFLGMAGGAWLASRFGDRLRRPLVVYALLELVTGAYAISTLPLLERLHLIYGLTGVELPIGALLLLKGALSLLVLAVPAMAMGATLPLVVASSRDGGRLGMRTATLYGANTAGAVVGCLLAGLVVIAACGYLGALVVGAALNLGAAVVALVAQRHQARAGEAARASSVTTTPHQGDGAIKLGAMALMLAGLGGFAGMAFEMAFARVLHVVLMGTIETVSTVLAAFLFGVAAGSAAVRGLATRIRFGVLEVGWLLALSAAAVMLSSYLLEPLAFVGSGLASQGGLAAAGLRFLCAAAALVLPAALNGALFPALVDLVAGARGGESVGRLLAANTVGSVLGAFAGGVILLPWLGTSATLYIVMLGLLLAALLCSYRARRRQLGVVAVLLVVFASTLWSGVDVARLAQLRELRMPTYTASVAQLDANQQHTLFSAEGAHGVVSLVERPSGVLHLNIDGLPQSTSFVNGPRYPLESVLLGALPAVLARGTERALVIGLGTGITARSLLASGFTQVEVAEIEPRVVEALEHVERASATPAWDERMQILIADGRDLLQRRRYQAVAPGYDVIASQPTHWWLSGVGNLATREFFSLAYDALVDGGVYIHWLNVGRMTEEVLRGVVGAMQATFEHTLVLVADQPGLLYGVGVRGALHLDAARIEAQLARPALRELAAGMPDDLIDLAAWVVYHGERGAVSGAPANRDRDALVETRLARISDSTTLDLGTLRPPPLGELGLPASALAIDRVAIDALRIETFERRLNTPGGLPRLVVAGFDGPVPFGPAMITLAERAAEAAAHLDPCWRRYLDGRLMMARAELDTAAAALRQVCPESPAHPAALRAARFFALLALDSGRCEQGLTALSVQATSASAFDHYLAGLLRACLDQDPGVDYRTALSSWDAPGLPGAAMRWAVQRGEPLPETLRARASKPEVQDLDALRAIAVDDVRAAELERSAQHAQRLARLISERLRALKLRARRLERRGDLARAQLVLARLTLLAPQDPAAALMQMGFYTRRGQPEIARELGRRFIENADDPEGARRMLALAKEGDISLNEGAPTEAEAP